ncbi:MAG: Gfo/Idh/MocA family oxidoreductase [Verrucomicrobiota bacterium]
MATKKKRYALCGLSTRAIYHFVLPLIGKNREGGPNFDNTAELVGILDADRARVETFLGKVGVCIPIYPPKAIRRMIKETKPDTLIVVGPDVTHCDHIVAGLDAGCDVIAEKPMVISCKQVRRVQEAEQRSGRRVRVAHNYRYTPTHKRLKRMIQGGELGRIVNVEFTYNLDTWHGSSYFYRWNRMREMSGGLSIHKCCHHFDLANWWLGDIPEEVFAFGGLNYYGPNGAIRPRDAQGKPFPPEEEKKQCPIFQKHYIEKRDPSSNFITPGWDEFELPYDVQYPTGEPRYIYDDAIEIEDAYSAVVRYRSGATMAYSCNFCTPWEGYVLAFNGTKGRVEIVHRSDPDPTGKTTPAADAGLITFYPLFGGKQLIEIPAVAGGHGGADFAIQNDLFGSVAQESQELKLVADSQAGAYAIAMGEAVWKSIASGRPMNIAKMLD